MTRIVDTNGLDDTRDAREDNKLGQGVIYPWLSYRIMEGGFEVHNTLGPGFVEGVYEQALAHELEVCGIPFERQKKIQVHYKGCLVGTHRLDFVVDGRIVLELKAASALTDAFKQQALSYLKATVLKLGILVNFGTPRVEYVRIVN